MISVVLKIVAVLTLNISLYYFFDIPDNYIVPVFIFTIFIIQQATNKYSWSRRINDSVHVFCILACLFSIRILVESDFDSIITLCVIVFNVLLLFLSSRYKDF